MQKPHIRLYVPQVSWVCFLLITMTSCKPSTQVFESDCDHDQQFIKVSFSHLIDSLPFYDHKYIETTGVYREGKERSALYNDTALINNDKRGLWVNFTQDCMLYQQGTHNGFFEDNNGGFLKIDNRHMRIRGRIDVHNQGHQKRYKGCIDHVSLVSL
jgi:hypothetical protein